MRRYVGAESAQEFDEFDFGLSIDSSRCCSSQHRSRSLTELLNTIKGLGQRRPVHVKDRFSVIEQSASPLSLTWERDAPLGHIRVPLHRVARRARQAELGYPRRRQAHVPQPKQTRGVAVAIRRVDLEAVLTCCIVSHGLARNPPISPTTASETALMSSAR